VNRRLLFACSSGRWRGSYYPAEFKNWPPQLYWFIGALVAIMLFVTILLPELVSI
jgi:hypothetical protein